MRGKKAWTLVASLLAIVVSFFVLPSTGQAVIIDQLTVSFGAACFGTGCPVTAANTALLSTWFGAPNNLGSTGTIVFAQSGGTPGTNFDTSDANASGACSVGSPCATPVITVHDPVNGTKVFNDNGPNGTGTDANVLISKNVDVTPNLNAPPQLNEAHNFVQIGSVGGNDGYDIFVGYFDNLHQPACADTDGNCMPDPFFGNTFVRGAGTFNGNGFTPVNEINPNHCANASTPPGTSTQNCWDSGVIRIVAHGTVVPEPSAVLLLGVGLLGLAAWKRVREN